MEWLKVISIRLGGFPFGRDLIGWIIRHMSYYLPLHRLYESDTLIAFKHPQPTYPLHILLVPKKPLSGLMAITQTDQLFLSEMITCVQELVKQFDLEERGYRLIANGGAFQEYPYLHFHLIAENPPKLPII